MLIKRSLWPPQQKPGPGSELECGHPLAQRMAACWILHEGAGKLVRNFVHPLSSVYFPSANCAWVSETSGQSVRLNLATEGLAPLIDIPISWASGGFSLYAQATFYSQPTAYANTIFYRTGFVWHIDQTSLVIRVQMYDGAGWRNTKSTQTITLGRLQSLGVAYNPTSKTVSLYRNGDEVTYSSQTALTQPFPGTAGLPSIGVYSGSYPADTSFTVFHAWARTLTANEFRQVHTEPYAMIRPAGPPRRYFTVSALDQVFDLQERRPRFVVQEAV